MIEGAVYLIKEAILVSNIKNTKNMLAADFFILTELSFNLDHKGLPKYQQKFIKIEDNIKFIANCAEKYLASKIKLNIGSKERDNFLKLIKIRNRITHPKSMQDFTVSEKEISLAQDVCFWFNGILMKIVNDIYSLSNKNIK